MCFILLFMYLLKCPDSAELILSIKFAITLNILLTRIVKPLSTNFIKWPIGKFSYIQLIAIGVGTKAKLYNKTTYEHKLHMEVVVAEPPLE